MDLKESFACYSLPGEDNYTLMTGNVIKLQDQTFPNSAGFLFTSFDNQTWFLDARSISQNQPFSFDSSGTNAVYNASKEEYFTLCDKFIENCNQSFKKIILSRIISKPKRFTATEVFHALRVKYPKAFVYMINSSENGCWIGASPETFLTRKKGEYETMALAGTMATNNDDTNWKPKEINEQKLVSDYISEKLNDLNIQTNMNGPFSKVAGNVMHLCSEYRFSSDVKREYIISELHPTPAVCGIPTSDAFDIIKKLEPHDRDLYCGYLGPINIDNTDRLFVNLRCLKADESQLHLYVGGGITADSVIEAEWEETEMKSRTLLGVIENL